MKILNLYAGIGGNRKLWGDDHKITAIEYNREIADIYHDFFPKDNIVVTDAHQYLLDHYKEYDFIWSSPPCPTHSRTQIMSVLSDSKQAGCHNRKAVYPDMKLYQEIILLDNFALKNTKWVVENVIPYYKTLLEPSIQISRHNFWCNFHTDDIKIKENRKHHGIITGNETVYGYNISEYDIDYPKRKILRNLVNPEIGKYILDQAMNIKTPSDQKYLF